jgi:DNA primase large subunit
MSAAVREDWPPCFESAVAELSQGINVNHTGRVFLAAMSRAMGHTPEITSSFFASAPDYNQETTTYQVNHIYERQYTPHGCQGLKTGARCPVSPGEDRLCDQEWMNHPLKYLRAKQRRRYQEGVNTEDDDATQKRTEGVAEPSKMEDSS